MLSPCYIITHDHGGDVTNGPSRATLFRSGTMGGRGKARGCVYVYLAAHTTKEKYTKIGPMLKAPVSDSKAICEVLGYMGSWLLCIVATDPVSGACGAYRLRGSG